MKLSLPSSLILKVFAVGIVFFALRSCLAKRQVVLDSDTVQVTIPVWQVEKTEKLLLKIPLLFYWKQWPINENSTFNKQLLAKADTIKSTSAVWTKKGYPSKGYGTYRFFIKQQDVEHQSVLNLSRVLGACEVWINGKKQAVHGTLSKNLANSVDGIPALSVTLPKEETLDVMLLVSNGNSRLGGGFPLQNSINEKERFSLIKQRKFAFEGLITFLILVFGIYQLFVYKGTGKEKYFLYFGLFCLFGGARQLFVGETFIFKIFPDISFELVQRLRYICFYGGLAFAFLYHHYLFPKYYSRSIVALFTVIPFLGVIYVLCTSVFYGTYSIPFFHVFGLLNLIAAFWLIVKAMNDGQPFAKQIFLNLLIITVIFTNDILNALMVLQTNFVANMGLLAYVFFQMYLNHKIAKEEKERLLNMTAEVQSMNDQIQVKEAEISKLLHESYHHLKTKKQLAENLKKVAQNDASISVNTIVKELRSELLEDNQLNAIKSEIEMLNYDFIKRLKEDAPVLTSIDLEICSYIHMGLSRKEIARLRHTTVEATRKSRYRIRKKLALEADDDLEHYLRNV